MTSLADFSSTIAVTADMPDVDLDNLLVASDAAQHKTFLAGSSTKDHVKIICTVFVNKFLNNPNADEVPLRKKTKFLLVMNNFALQKNLRSTVFNAFKHMDGIFEESMKKEGAMPFDSELGRMSEHVLVLLMRVMNYKLKASQVHEFAEHNTQFAVQLLLAILLKEPPYEFDLRCNCISGLLGFTQPQAFFEPGAPIELHSCEKFSEKVDFISNLMLRLSALQVVNDVLTPHLADSPSVLPQVHVAICNTMRCAMNIFQFVSQGATQWRQHVLLSTTFVDSVMMMYLQAQTRTLDSLLGVSMNRTPVIATDLLGGLSLGLKFMAFATFHMGRHGKSIRPMCVFVHELLQMPIQACLADPKQAAQFAAIYAQLLHFLANIDALAGDDGVVEDEADMLPELSSATLRTSVETFLKTEVLRGGAAAVELFQKKFYAVETDSLVSQDCVTFHVLDALFTDLKTAAAPAPAPVAPVVQAAPASSEPKKSLLGDMPSFGKPAVAKTAAPTQPVVIQQSFVAPKAVAKQAETNKYACALNGHTMKVPVLSPYGHTFEKDTIEQWIQQQGTVCPITGNVLSLSDLKPNTVLQNEIMQEVVMQSMSMANQEDEADLYDF